MRGVPLASGLWHNTDAALCRAFTLAAEGCLACRSTRTSSRPCRLSQRPALSHVPGCPRDDLSGRGLYHLVPRVGPTGLTPVAARVGDHHAVSGAFGGSSGSGGRPRAHRLEVSAESRPDGSWLRLFGPE